jgi:dTMP kinase
MSTRGIFLAFEGGEGVGKSTQLRLFASWMEERGVPHLMAREPGGTPVGEAIRQILLDRAELDIPAETELLLMLAARAAFVRRVVLPTLERGAVMVADRYQLSSFVYQGIGRGLGVEAVRGVNAFATGGVEPDLTVLFDLSIEEGIARQEQAGKRRDRIEASGREFLTAVREGYLALAKGDEGVVVLDASLPAQELHARVCEVVRSRFPGTFGQGID